MDYEGLLLEKEAGIATITLNVPEKLNAITREMSRNLPLVTDEIAKDDDIRVVIVTGAGRGFSSGADVSMMAGGSGGTRTLYERLQVTGWPHCDVFPNLNKPVIGAINGVAVGGGFALALSCDVRIASETARFGALQLARALVPDFGLTYYLPVAVGMSKALEIMFTGEMIGAAEAERVGIVSKVVPADDLMKAALELAEKIAQQAPIPVGFTKQMVWRARMDELERQLDLESHAQPICMSTEDHKESVKAFLEKRPVPPFKGK